MIFKTETIHLKSDLKLVLRSPEDRDAKDILSYLKTVTGETRFLLRYPFECFEDQEAEAAFILSINKEAHQAMILATVNDEIVGICNVGLKTKLKIKHRATLGISVKKQYWGLGIGSILMDQMIVLAQRFGAERLELEVIEGNDRAIKLYLSKGFQFASELKEAIKETDGTYYSEFVMTKAL
jgi:RimJ/RimL family protein N-acetyltransferase